MFTFGVDGGPCGGGVAEQIGGVLGAGAAVLGVFRRLGGRLDALGIVVLWGGCEAVSGGECWTSPGLMEPVGRQRAIHRSSAG